jgi:hypothetical protein
MIRGGPMPHMPCDDVFTTIHTLVDVSRDDQKRPQALQGIQVFPEGHSIQRRGLVRLIEVKQDISWSPIG